MMRREGIITMTLTQQPQNIHAVRVTIGMRAVGVAVGVVGLEKRRRN